MCILEKLNFKISRGTDPAPPPPPPSVLAPSALVPIFAGPTMGNSQYNITYLNQTKTFSFFSLEKSAPSVLYIDIYILRAADIRSAQARSAPPPLPRRKSCVRACHAQNKVMVSTAGSRSL